MKKILIATTALVATAGVAAADVAVSGSGRMGVTYQSNDVNAVTNVATARANKMAFTSRMRVVFTASGETDGGLTFGGSVRADNAAGGNAGTAGSVFISGNGVTLTMGDVDGAAEKVVGDLAGVGLTGIGDWNENTYLSNNAAVNRSAARVDYTVNGFTLSASADNPGGDVVVLPAAAGTKANTFAVGVGYTMGDYTVGLGYESSKMFVGAANTTVGHIIAGASATFNGVTVKATYGKASKLDFTQYGISASGKFDATTVTAFYRVTDDKTVGALDKSKYLGLGASYDLGGGASVVGGIANQKRTLNAVKSSQTRADMGVSFSF